MTAHAKASSIRVVLVDDSALVRQGIKAVLAAEAPRPPITVVGEAPGVAEAVSTALRLKPDVVLLEYACRTARASTHAAKSSSDCPTRVC
jgi:chemotaxis response regulator CheB